MKLTLALFLFITFAPGSHATPAQVLIIRHAEKPDGGQDLSPEGYAHAQKLVAYFQSNPQVLKYGLPVAIYAMGPKEGDTTDRPIKTVTPLASALHLDLQTQFRKLDQQALANAVLNNPSYDGKMVLICWEHKAIREMVADFGVAEDPGKWHGQDFSTVYSIEYSNSGQVKNFTQFEQEF